VFASLNCISDWFLDLLINNKSVRSELVEDSMVCLIQTRLSGSPIEAWIPDSSIQDMNLPTDQAWSSVLAFEAEKPCIYHVYLSKPDYLGHPLKLESQIQVFKTWICQRIKAWSSVLAFEAEKPSIHHVHILL